EKESQRNITLLKEKPWFDIPIVYTDGRRAILAIEKGRSGERAFGQAFAAWGSPAPGSATPDRKGSPAVGKGDRVPPSPAAPPDSIKTPLEDSEPWGRARGRADHAPALSNGKPSTTSRPPSVPRN